MQGAASPNSSFNMLAGPPCPQASLHRTALLLNVRNSCSQASELTRGWKTAPFRFFLSPAYILTISPRFTVGAPVFTQRLRKTIRRINSRLRRCCVNTGAATVNRGEIVSMYAGLKAHRHGPATSPAPSVPEEGSQGPLSQRCGNGSARRSAV